MLFSMGMHLLESFTDVKENKGGRCGLFSRLLHWRDKQSSKLWQGWDRLYLWILMVTQPWFCLDVCLCFHIIVKFSICFNDLDDGSIWSMRPAIWTDALVWPLILGSHAIYCDWESSLSTTSWKLKMLQWPAFFPRIKYLLSIAQ